MTYHRPSFVVSGSREELSSTDAFTIIATLERHHIDQVGDKGTLYHGGATGVDKFVANAADKWGLQIIPYPVTEEQWRTQGKAAGPRRNRQMLDDAKPGLCFAFPRPESKGTKDFIRAATERHLNLVVMWLPSASEWQ